MHSSDCYLFTLFISVHQIGSQNVLLTSLDDFGFVLQAVLPVHVQQECPNLWLKAKGSTAIFVIKSRRTSPAGREVHKHCHFGSSNAADDVAPVHVLAKFVALVVSVDTNVGIAVNGFILFVPRS